MYQHMILMCSDYSSEKRIAFHKSYTDIAEMSEFEDIAQELEDRFRNVEFSFHQIPTESSTIKSVIDYDNYFQDVKFYSDKTEFKSSVKKSIKITPDDIVKWILTKRSFDPLQIQKLIYFVYLEYSKKHEDKLFQDAFEAWQYGPVIPEIYYKLNKYGKQKIKLEDKELEKLKLKLKISRSYEKEDICECIDNVINKYGKKTGGQLIDLTHESGSPWDEIYHNSGCYSEIPSQLIKEYAMKMN